MKNKNYALKFSLSLTLCILMPIFILIYTIIIVVSISAGELELNEIYKPLLVFLLSVGFALVFTFITWLFCL